MNAEIANRLFQYRKRSNFSQEELAEKLGISRQAVSKWERAEASPDTDNLINLAKLYGVTLDELIGTDPLAEQSDNKQEDNQASDGKKNENDSSQNVKKHVYIDDNGIRVEKGEKAVYIDSKGLRFNKDNKSEKSKRNITINGMQPKWADIPLSIIIGIAYLLMGIEGGWWHPGWIIFLLIPIGHGIIEAIIKRQPRLIPYPIIAAGVFLLLGTVWNCWNPGWIVFLTIPIFYWLVD